MLWLINLLNPLTAIVDKIAGAYEKKASAQTDQQKIAADVEIAALEARRDVLLKDPYGGLVRFLWAAPFIIYDLKLVFWDKVLGLGSTDPLSQELAITHGMIVGFYFLRMVWRR